MRHFRFLMSIYFFCSCCLSFVRAEAPVYPKDFVFNNNGLQDQRVYDKKTGEIKFWSFKKDKIYFESQNTGELRKFKFYIISNKNIGYVGKGFINDKGLMLTSFFKESSIKKFESFETLKYYNQFCPVDKESGYQKIIKEFDDVIKKSKEASSSAFDNLITDKSCEKLSPKDKEKLAALFREALITPPPVTKSDENMDNLENFSLYTCLRKERERLNSIFNNSESTNELNIMQLRLKAAHFDILQSNGASPKITCNASAPASFDPSTNTFNIDPESPNLRKTIYHEVIHAVRPIANDTDSKKEEEKVEAIAKTCSSKDYKYIENLDDGGKAFESAESNRLASHQNSQSPNAQQEILAQASQSNLPAGTSGAANQQNLPPTPPPADIARTAGDIRAPSTSELSYNNTVPANVRGPASELITTEPGGYYRGSNGNPNDYRNGRENARPNGGYYEENRDTIIITNSAPTEVVRSVEDRLNAQDKPVYTGLQKLADRADRLTNTAIPQAQAIAAPPLASATSPTRGPASLPAAAQGTALIDGANAAAKEINGSNSTGYNNGNAPYVGGGSSAGYRGGNASTGSGARAKTANRNTASSNNIVQVLDGNMPYSDKIDLLNKDATVKKLKQNNITVFRSNGTIIGAPEGHIIYVDDGTRLDRTQ